MKKGNLGMRKFLQTIDESIYARLEKQAKRRGITLQELMRAIVIPTWLDQQKD